MKAGRIKFADGSHMSIDFTNIAVWQRFAPFVAKSDAWKTFFSYPNGQSDNLGKRIRHTSLFQMARHVIAKGINGHFVECGCAGGHSTFMMASALKGSSRSSRLIIFDSFEGLSPLDNEDQTFVKGSTDVYGMRKAASKGGAFAVSLEEVAPFFTDFPFVEFYKGWVPDRFNEVENESFAFVNLDLDLYQPTLDSLEFFFPRLEKGGVMHIDDYNFTDWPGVKCAIDEYLSNKDYSLFYEIPLGGAFLVK
ncbi:MAG: hypothetical protein CMM25_02335 [Rhodospirillaceae bacterium]|nr:hypothetical protein [Rhodospirillaceae bacterium]